MLFRGPLHYDEDRQNRHDEQANLLISSFIGSFHNHKLYCTVHPSTPFRSAWISPFRNQYYQYPEDDDNERASRAKGRWWEQQDCQKVRPSNQSLCGLWATLHVSSSASAYWRLLIAVGLIGGCWCFMLLSVCGVLFVTFRHVESR